MRNLHDRLMKKVLDYKSEAKAIVKSFLPKWIAKDLDFRYFKRSKTSYISEALQEYFMDIVYNARFKNGSKLNVIFLFEHKSYYDEGILDQLLRYLTEIYTLQYLNNEERVMVLPIVIFHGTDIWKIKRFSDNFDLPNKNWRAYLPDFDYHLIDLNAVAEEFLLNLKTGHFMRSAFLLFKHHKDAKYLLENYQEIFIFVKLEITEAEKMAFVQSLLRYILEVYSMSDQEKKTFIQNVKKMDIIVEYAEGSIAEDHVREGEKKGIKKGIEKGEKKGALLKEITLLLMMQKNMPHLSIVELGRQYKLNETMTQVLTKALKKSSVDKAIHLIMTQLFKDMDLSKEQIGELKVALQAHS